MDPDSDQDIAIYYIPYENKKEEHIYEVRFNFFLLADLQRTVLQYITLEYI
jgi:hypothetical protein